ncbi:MAG TPA: metallophosphoesterase [Gaiellaceae bacterium]|nr:metallophosphoesterase [Gaiellaceae bacterium]
MVVAIVVLVALVAAGLAWGWFEAGWLRRHVLEVEIAGLPTELDGMRIAHLSDFHLGVVSPGSRATRDAVRWVADRRPDLVCVTGDLVSRRQGLGELQERLRELAPCFVVLGNHDFAASRDPFSQPIAPEDLARIEGVCVLIDQSVEVAVRDRPVQLVGVDPRSYADRAAHPEELIDQSISLRILLCHFPDIARTLPAGSFQLVLSGHFHAGQIVLPLPGRRLRLAHLGARDVEGVYRHGDTTLHVSSGLGTTFVPFRFFARPEVTELVVRSASR